MITPSTCQTASAEAPIGRGWFRGILAGSLLLTGCASYPLGLSQEQWEALPAERQAEYRAQQAQINEARAAREAEREWIEQEAALREQEHLRAAYDNARHGDIITVAISGGLVAFHGKRHPYEPVAFDLIRGETKLVEFTRQDRPEYRTQIAMHLSEDGNTFTFDAPARKRVILLNEGWDRGRRYTPPELGAHDGHSEAIGITIYIRLKQLPDPPRRVIIERR